MAKKKVVEQAPVVDDAAQQRLDREARKAKRRADPDAVRVAGVVSIEPEDYTGGSIRTATKDDPAGKVETVIQNSPVKAPESPVDELIN
jgi:hypothetical protein